MLQFPEIRVAVLFIIITLIVRNTSINYYGEGCEGCEGWGRVEEGGEERKGRGRKKVEGRVG